MPRRGTRAAAADSGESHLFTYNGPARAFRVAEGAEPVGPGETVSLTNAQVRALVRGGHRFSADTQVGNAALDAAREAQRAERERLALAAQQQQQAGG